MKKAMTRISLPLLTLGLAALVGASALPVSAQPGGFRGPDGRGGPRRSSAKMRLSRMWNGIGRLEQSGTPVSRAQAKRLVTLVRPWSSRPTMTEAQAQSLSTQISSVLTASQKAELDKRRGRGGRDGGRPDGPPPGGFGGRRGDRDGRGMGGPGGPPPGFDPNSAEGRQMRQRMEGARGLMQTMNPFYSPARAKGASSLPSFMREGMQRRYDESRATLAALTRKAS